MTRGLPARAPGGGRGPCRRLGVVLVAWFGLVAGLHAAHAPIDPAKHVVSRVIAVRGEVDRFEHDAAVWAAARRGQPLAPGDSVRTGASSGASLRISDGSLVRLNEKSLFELTVVDPRETTLGAAAARAVSLAATRSIYELKQGEAWVLNKDPSADVEIRTPSATLGIRGTEFNLRVAPDGTGTVTVLEGYVAVGNAQGSVTAGPGEQVVAAPGSAPVKTLLLQPADAVQWTLVVPDLFGPDDLAAGVTPAEQQAASTILGDVRDGRLAAARQALVAQRRGGATATWELLESWIDLHGGDPGGAARRLEALVGSDPRNAAAWRVLALASLVLDRRERATSALETARQLDAAAPAGWLLGAQLAQARFDLDAAVTDAAEALRLEPGHVAALVTLARLRFGQGYTAEARDLAERAVALAPNNGAALNLLGFVALGAGDTETAAGHFERAIDLGGDLAEPWLGRGLVALRRGEAAAGLDALATAVLLEPRRALLRTYWAKGLHEVGHRQKALDVLDVSRELDPRDPSPAFYRALVLRDLRRPDEAIAALHEAQAKNGYRGVYRSRFLLDADSAVRNVDLALLFAELGLPAWSLRGAVDAVTDDYANASAHLQYAGSLADAPDRSWARNTENLLARLLQPANINTFNTFNEYTTLVERPGGGASAELTVGEHDTREGQLIVYGADPGRGVAFGIGGLRRQTDGWRDSNFERQGDVVAYLKWDPTADHGLMFAASGSDSELGDKLLPRYEHSDPAEPRDRTDGETRRFEVGYHRRLAPGSDLLLHASRLDVDVDLHNVACLQASCDAADWFELVSDAHLEEPYSLFQGTWLRRHDSHQWLAGAAWYDGEQELDLDRELQAGPPPASGPLAPVAAKQDRQSASAWLHDIWQFRDDVVVHAALHVESMDNGDAVLDASTDIDEITPRLGVAWRVTAQDTLRFAAFRGLLPFLSDRIDPADIAGIPVHRNGQAGSITDEAHVSWERAWPRGFLRLDAYRFERELEQDLNGGGRQRTETDSNGVQAAAELLLGHGLGLALGYAYRTFDDDPASDISRDDQLAEARLTWVDPRGFGARIGQTWRHVDFDGGRSTEELWITDVEVSYEFPAKRGRVALAVDNLFDERFDWFTDPFDTRGRIPEREARLTVTLNL